MVKGGRGISARSDSDSGIEAGDTNSCDGKIKQVIIMITIMVVMVIMVIMVMVAFVVVVVTINGDTNRQQMQ